jgi:hypothetical protein
MNEAKKKSFFSLFQRRTFNWKAKMFLDILQNFFYFVHDEKDE